MHKKILLIVLTYLFLFPLVGCFPPGPYTPPPCYSRFGYYTIAFYDQNNEYLGIGSEDGIRTVHCFDFDKNKINFITKDNGEKIIDQLSVLDLEYKLKCEVNGYLPKQQLFKNDYIKYCENFYENPLSFTTTFSYEIVQITDKSVFEEDTLRKIFTKYQNEKDSWEKYRLKYYITDMDIENYMDYIEVIYEDNVIRGFSFKSSIDLLNGEYYSIETFKTDFNNIVFVDNEDIEDIEINENDENNIIVITTTYLFDEKYIKRSEEQLKKYIFTLLSYDTCVCVPFGVGISVEYIPLSAYSPNMIKIWKNDTFNN